MVLDPGILDQGFRIQNPKIQRSGFQVLGDSNQETCIQGSRELVIQQPRTQDYGIHGLRPRFCCPRFQGLRVRDQYPGFIGSWVSDHGSFVTGSRILRASDQGYCFPGSRVLRKSYQGSCNQRSRVLGAQNQESKVSGSRVFQSITMYPASLVPGSN